MLSGGRRYTKFVCVRSVFVRVQRGGNIARHLPFRNPDSSGQLHCGDIHHQLYTVLLADVPGDFPAEPPAVRTSAYFSACCKRINGVGPHSRAVRNGGNEYFCDNYC